MTSISTSFSPLDPQRPRAGSPASRFSYAASSVERGELEPDADAGAGQQLIEEEIAEIKRYEDFSTIDWVQDAARERGRRKLRDRKLQGFYDNGTPGWRYRLRQSYDAAQGWLVITLIGAAIGFNAAFLNIITEWLAGLKSGYCSTGFYLNESFCCWGENDGCDDWHHWTGFAPLNYLIYIMFAGILSFTAAVLVKSFAPYAAGSGISEIKCILAGFVMKGFLGFWTLVIKSLALPLAIGSGLTVGKEGPSVHYAVCTGNVISRLFDKYNRSASKTREILSACAAAGVAVAFGSPIGGVLFSLEEMSGFFPMKTLWRSYFCALVAIAVLSAMNPFRTGQLVMFQVQYDRSWHFFEVVFFVIIGAFGGLYGAFVIKWNLRAQAFRKKYLSQYPVLEAVILATSTAVLAYPNAFLRIDMTKSMEILFRECEGAEDYHGLCDPNWRLANILSLAITTFLRVFLVIISYGCKVPAGIFVPSMAIGAAFGRMVGIIVEAIHQSSPESWFFAACKPDEPCITPGTYAFLGAAAALSGIMHITVSVVVIMFELTGALTYILPTMLVVGVTKAVGSFFGKGGIADRAIWFSGYPFLDNKEDHNYGVPVSQVMRTALVSLPVSGLTLAEIEGILEADSYQGFPIVESENSKVLVGYIGHTELKYAISRLRRDGPINPMAKCTFHPVLAPNSLLPPITPTVTVSGDSTASATSLAFGRFVDTTPVTVHPRLPLETVMELFRKIGPRVILIEYHGKLTGLVTVKDCLKYQFKVEIADGHPRYFYNDSEGQEKVWSMIRRAAGWLSDQVSHVSGGRIRLSSSSDDDDARRRETGGIMNGDEDIDDEGLELESRDR